MAERDANQLAADVRPVLESALARALDTFYPEDGDLYPHAEERAVAALDELVALVGTLQQERDDMTWRRDWQYDKAIGWRERAVAAEAALAEANAERDRMRDKAYNAARKKVDAEAALAEANKDKERLHTWGEEWKVRARDAEAALAEMEQRWLGMRDCYDREVIRCGKAERALTEIAARKDGGREGVAGIAAIARRALADTGGDTEYDQRCPAMHPRSSKPDRCQRPRGHSGDHVSTSHSGEVKVYPSKWTDADTGGDTA